MGRDQQTYGVPMYIPSTRDVDGCGGSQTDVEGWNSSAIPTIRNPDDPKRKFVYTQLFEGQKATCDEKNEGLAHNRLAVFRTHHRSPQT